MGSKGNKKATILDECGFMNFQLLLDNRQFRQYSAVLA